MKKRKDKILKVTIDSPAAAGQEPGKTYSKHYNLLA